LQLFRARIGKDFSNFGGVFTKNRRDQFFAFWGERYDPDAPILRTLDPAYQSLYFESVFMVPSHIEIFPWNRASPLPSRAELNKLMLRLPRRVQQSFQTDEVGRACVHEDYRNTAASFLLWKGIASYATLCYARYLIGCWSSLPRTKTKAWRSTAPSATNTSFDAGTLLFLSVGFCVRYQARQFA
jgi:hypothetical protein